MRGDFKPCRPSHHGGRVTGRPLNVILWVWERYKIGGGGVGFQMEIDIIRKRPQLCYGLGTHNFLHWQIIPGDTGLDYLVMSQMDAVKLIGRIP